MAELMKGKVFGEHKHKLKYPVIAEIKYDEIRLHVKLVKAADRLVCDDVRYTMHEVQFLSYAGKPIANMGGFVSRFADFFIANPDITELDMGLLVNGNFNDSYRWARSTKGIPEGLDEGMVKFMLFDVPDFGWLDFWTADGDCRYVRRDRIGRALNAVGLSVEEPNCEVLSTEAEVDDWFHAAREEGHEGLMVKSREHKYLKGKRIDGWLKMKPEAEADGVIEGFTEAISEEGVPLGRAGSISIRCEDGSTAAPHGIAHELGKHMWENPEQYIGQWCMFKYMELDRQGGYRHPTFIRLREAKA